MRRSGCKKGSPSAKKHAGGRSALSTTQARTTWRERARKPVVRSASTSWDRRSRFCRRPKRRRSRSPKSRASWVTGFRKTANRRCVCLFSDLKGLGHRGGAEPAMRSVTGHGLAAWIDRWKKHLVSTEPKRPQAQPPPRQARAKVPQFGDEADLTRRIRLGDLLFSEGLRGSGGSRDRTGRRGRPRRARRVLARGPGPARRRAARGCPPPARAG